MDLPDCPPGAEGYQDTVVQVPKKPDDSECTKAEQEFQEHLNSLKVRVEDGTTRCMVERRGRDVSHNWIYLCYPCAAVCCGEHILQIHISGKKHKNSLMLKSVWPPSIFENHPYLLKEKGSIKTGATPRINRKMAEEVAIHNHLSETDQKYQKYRESGCHIQETLDKVKTPLLGTEYLIEHPPEESNQEQPSYLCTLCNKQGHQRTIVNHITCFQHRCNYFARHFYKASTLLAPHRRRTYARKGVLTVVNRLAQRIEDKYGRLKPVNIDKDEFERDKERIIQWIFKGFHFSEDLGLTFEEVVDEELINSLSEPDPRRKKDYRNPSPPNVAGPAKPRSSTFNAAQTQHKRAGSTESLSDISDEELQRSDGPRDTDMTDRDKKPINSYVNNRGTSFRTRYALKNTTDFDKTTKSAHYQHKLEILEEMKQAAIDAAKKTLAYHEKNPEKHPLYPEEWKKFWNKRYKEIQADGKDPSKHDFKSEWIPFWTTRMKELHEDELRINISELYRRLCVPMLDSDPFEESRPSEDRRSPGGRRRSPVSRNRPADHSRSPVRNRPADHSRSPVRNRPADHSRSPVRNRSIGPRRRSPDLRRRSPDQRRRSPFTRRRSPDLKRRSPDIRRRSPELKRRSPFPRRPSPEGYDRPPSPKRKSPYPRRAADTRRYSPDQRKRSPVSYRRDRRRLDSPGEYNKEADRRNTSPLSQRVGNRNLSPSTHTAPSLQTVLISDDELRPDDGLSPWNSDNDIDSVDSIIERRSHTASVASRNSRSKLGAHGPPQRGALAGAPPTPQDFGPTDNVIATLRLLVALEDYLGSLGPKVVDLLTEALKMEKEKANSSEELLDREGAVALLETAKEKLKGAVQAGLVPAGATAAVRAAIMRLAAALHEADKRDRDRSKAGGSATGGGGGDEAVAVAGVGAVDRAEIAAQMAAALVAEGRTDVSPQELEQLIDAVVGMAEAKKRESQARKQSQMSGQAQSAADVKSSTTTALQMLQSAYDDPNAPAPKDDTSDAMDGLSDSDLETLLKNFNELSAEEQHSLIAYLKKLEMRSPQRVEKLRQFVGAAAAGAPPADTDLVTIQSDDDDYTVEEVFKSVTQKVKENQIQQEMEIVKKSLEETKAIVEPASTESVNTEPSATITLSISSAADLLALVHASIQSTSQSKQEDSHTAQVASTNQPRSFGDLPESVTRDTIKPMLSVPSHLSADFQSQQSPNNQQARTNTPQSQMSFNTNIIDSNEACNDNMQGQTRQSLMTENIQSSITDRQNMTQNRPPFMGDNLQSLMSDKRQFSTNDSYQPSTNESRQPSIGDNIPPPMVDCRQPPDNRPPFMGDNRQPVLGNRPLLLGDNRQPQPGDNRQPSLGDSWSLQSDYRPTSIENNTQSLMGINRPPLPGASRPPLQGDNRQFSMENNRQPIMTGNRQQQQSVLGDNRQSFIGDINQPMGDNRWSSTTDNNSPFAQNEQTQMGYDNYNQNRSFNPRGRINFRNNCMQDKFNTQPEMNQQHCNNYQKNPMFRGRGRGFQAGGRGFPTGGRGRGRGRR